MATCAHLPPSGRRTHTSPIICLHYHIACGVKTVKSRLPRSLRSSRKSRGRWASQPSRARGLRIETLEDRRLLTTAGGVDIPTTFDAGPEGEGDPAFVNGQILVQFKPGTTQQQINQILTTERATIVQTYYGLDNVALVNLPWHDTAGTPAYFTTQAVMSWKMKQEVAYAQTNDYTQNTFDAFPDDTLFSDLWGMHNNGQTGGTPDADIDAREAWDITTGTKDVVVAVIDSGIMYTHPDLRDNMWVNPGEIRGNGIDDDGNGYIDDVYGVSPATSPTNGDPQDFNAHGTHVAGTIGAEGNNDLGVVGVNWKVSLMAINVGEGPLGFTTAAILASVTYPTMMKERYGINVVVSNNSWGGGAPSPLIEAAFAGQIDAGIVVVAAAGNDAENNEAVPHYPSSYDLDGLIAVAASDHNDIIADFSNYGITSVDLFAPGVDIWSTVPPFEDPSGYASFQGTSMASPHVAGAVALVRGLAPELSALEAKELLLRTVDVKPSFEPYVLTGGRLNLLNALAEIESSHVTGNVFSDRNGDGAKSTGELGINNWTVYVDLNRNNRLDSGEPFDTTDATGNYDIEMFNAPGTYRVNQVIKPQWTQTFPSVGGHQITIAQRGVTVNDIDFGNQPLPGGVSGVKWNDLNGDGVYGSGEPGIPGVYIYADIDGNGTISIGEPAAITGADGTYVIYDIPAGTFAIREVLSPGWVLTYPAEGFHLIDVVPNQTTPNVDFGNKASFDFGDAPSPYPTLSSASGASAGLLSGFRLGALIDAENNGLPNPLAMGDDSLNLDDEDGVVITGNFYAGTTGTISVTVTATSRPSGYLQGWLDFNDDGDWLDAGEQIVVDRLLGSGTYSLNFAIPADATPGDTFARFRYSLQAGVGVSGHTTAGEVEDYAVRVLANVPVANPDSFEVEQDVIAAALDVLVNDFPSATGTLNILSVTQPPHGVVSISADRLSLTYTPNRGISSPPAEIFTYTVGDGTGQTSTASVNVFVRPTVLTPTAVDDSFSVTKTSSNNRFNVLVNDLAGVLGTMEILSVTVPGSGTATINNNGTPANTLDDYISYTPGAAFADVDTFQYTIGNANGNSTANVTVFETPAPTGKTTEITIEVLDSLGNPTSEIAVGSEFQLVASIQDVRGLADSLSGIYAAYMDILYARNLVTPNFDAGNSQGFEITFSSNYNQGKSGDILVPGVLNEVGAFQLAAAPQGSAKLEIFRAMFTATAAGTVNFQADPADVTPANNILYFDPPSAVPLADIGYGFTSLNIIAPTSGGSNQTQPLDVNNDSYITPLDALLVINQLNRNGSGAATTGSRLDVNRDGYITPLDALLVINYLNRRGGGVGEGEGGGDGLYAMDGGAGSGSLLVSGGLLTGSDTGSQNDSLISPLVALDDSQLPAAASDWQLRTGTAGQIGGSAADGDDLVDDFDAVLDLLAEDVSGAWWSGGIA